MAVIRVGERMGLSRTVNRLRQSTYTRKLVVECDSPDDGPVVVYAHPDVPKIGDEFRLPSGEVDTSSFVEEVACELESRSVNPPHSQHGVSVKYGPYEANLFPEEPDQWPIIVTFGYNEKERIVYFDRNGDPVVNSAGDRFEDPLTEIDYDTVITVRRNVLAPLFDLTVPGEFNGKLNLNAWNGFPPETVRIRAIAPNGDPQFHKSIGWYYQVVYPFEYRKGGWRRFLVDRGFATRGPDGKRRVILGADGQKLDEPRNLDGNGQELVIGSPVQMGFDTLELIDFSPRGLDFSRRLGV